MSRRRVWAWLAACVVSLLALAACSGASVPPAESGARWRPEPGLRWQWQLTGKLDLGVPADVYELDAFTTTAAQVARLHDAGRRAICYVNAGAYEDFRPDAESFPDDVLGRDSGWPGERWLDIRRFDVLGPILADRVELCRRKGFDAVEADNVDGYTNRTGFPLTAEHQLRFNRLVAALVHEHGMAVGLKNDLGQVSELEPAFDFAVNEQCFEFGECDLLTPFVRSGKAVFHAEYDSPAAVFCPTTQRLGLSSIRKRMVLDAWREACP
jgi:hypothetical protein